MLVFYLATSMCGLSVNTVQCLVYRSGVVYKGLMKKLELSKSNVDGKYILISTPNELFFLSVEILFSIAIF